VRAFVSGATGTVGREVCRTLVAHGAKVRVGVRATSDVTTILPDVTDVAMLDFESARIDPGGFEGVDAFFFMTPLIDDQVAASLPILEAASAAGVRHVVRLSSRATGWDEKSVLRRWHRELEKAVRDSGMSWTILRPCSFFQNFIDYQAETIRNMSSIIVPQGDGLIAYVDAADVGQVAAKCLIHAEDHRDQTYVLTGGRAYGVKGVAAEIGRVIGRPVTYISIEEEQARDMMWQRGLPQFLMEAALSVFAHARDGGEASVDPMLTTILGRPATTLSEFVEQNREAWG
jgi:uncharacterized protein YbjT (DUF2867 family)